MENYLVEAFNKMKKTRYPDLESIKKDYGEVEIFRTFLEFEGIIGYTYKILEVVELLKK